MIDPVLRQIEAMLRRDIDAAWKMRLTLPPSMWTEARPRQAPTRLFGAR
ncbi:MULTISPECIES: hypothetical protein [unclassified Roseivivax]|nr:hypothetical protein [Roseivivax sp. GX 12232]MCE0507066.1 hypothetical protein [Roseivivax sp. GX 12232]